MTIGRVIVDTDLMFKVASLVGSGGFVAGVWGAIKLSHRYLNNQHEREQMLLVGSKFRDVIAYLAADKDAVTRLSGAILIRRFFDADTELGGKGVYYQKEARSVIAAILRDMESSALQKVLADSLAYAPDLVKADLQKTNLQDAYWGADRRQVNLSGADLFGARMVNASLKGANAVEAIFYDADLSGAQFSRANLQGANFRNAVLRKCRFIGSDVRKAIFDKADLEGATFQGATLAGASFAQAKSVPPEITSRLSKEAVYE
jgi:uncharacterized protein YjbI with pentapeptide repeats